jgi:hypothetical protein
VAGVQQVEPARRARRATAGRTAAQVFRGLLARDDGTAMTTTTTTTATVTAATMAAGSSAAAAAAPLPFSRTQTTYDRFVAPRSGGGDNNNNATASDRPLFDVIQDAHARRDAAAAAAQDEEMIMKKAVEAPRGSEAALLPVRSEDEVRADDAFLQSIGDAERQRRQDLRGEDELALDEFRRARANGGGGDTAAAGWEASRAREHVQLHVEGPRSDPTATTALAAAAVAASSPQLLLAPTTQPLLQGRHNAARETAPATILRNRLVVTRKRKRGNAQDNLVDTGSTSQGGPPDDPEAPQQCRDEKCSLLVAAESCLVAYAQDSSPSSSSSSPSGQVRSASHS